MKQVYDLPTEVQLLIYNYVFDDVRLRRAVEARTMRGYIQAAAEKCLDTSPQLAIPLTCRAFRDDSYSWRTAMLSSAFIVVKTEIEFNMLRSAMSQDDANKIQKISLPTPQDLKLGLNLRKLFPNLKIAQSKLFSSAAHLEEALFVRTVEEGKAFKQSSNSNKPIPSTIATLLEKSWHGASGEPRWQDIVIKQRMRRNLHFFRYERILKEVLRHREEVTQVFRNILQQQLQLVIACQISLRLNGGTLELNGEFTLKDRVLRIEHENQIFELPQDVSGLFV